MDNRTSNTNNLSTFNMTDAKTEEDITEREKERVF